MAISQNKLLPVLGVVFVAMIGFILYRQFHGSDHVKSGDPLAKVPAPAKPEKTKGPNGKTLPSTRLGDTDNASETLNTVVASNKELRAQVAKVLERNDSLDADNRRLHLLLTGGGQPTGRPEGAGAPSPTPSSPGSVATSSRPVEPQPVPVPVQAGKAPTNIFEKALDTATRAVESVSSTSGPDDGIKRSRLSANTARTAQPQVGTGDQTGSTGQAMPDMGRSGAVSYQTRAPLGFMAVEEQQGGRNGAKQTKFVRNIGTADASPAAPMGVAQQAAAQAANKADEAYFTVPENATMTGVVTMTSLIGRVPIDGRVTDPMQFKAMIGRDNLAANGWELPGDVAGMIISGVAIGDMALSCSEGKIRSLTFVFNDGTIRTISSRARGGGGGNASLASAIPGSGSGDLGYISDGHGNPCIPGKFVTNAPAFLTDIAGLKTLGVAAAAYADAQRTTMTSASGTTSTVNNGNKYAMGQAVGGATDEVTKWMLERLKNSFDAVVTPAGIQMTVHIDQEIRLDKPLNARRIVHRNQALATSQRGDNHGLE